MRIRMGCLGWMLCGWVILPVFFLYLVARGVMEIFLACMKALDKHNRHVASRKARKAYLEDYYLRQGWRPPEPQDSPNWRPRG